MKNYSFLQEGIGLTNACAELGDTDPDILATIGPNVLKQYTGFESSIRFNYYKTKNHGFSVHSIIVHCKKQDKDQVLKLLDNLKKSTIPDIDNKNVYDGRTIRTIIKYTDTCESSSNDREETYIKLLD